MDNPILRMRAFFAHKSRAVELPEMTAFFKSCSDAEKVEFKAAIELWDGSSEFISATSVAASKPQAVAMLTA